LLKNHKEALEWRAAKQVTLDMGLSVGGEKEGSVFNPPYNRMHPNYEHIYWLFYTVVTISVSVFLFVGISSLITLIVMVICGLSGVIQEHASLSQAVVEQEQQLIGLRSALESSYSEEVIRSAKHAEELARLQETVDSVLTYQEEQKLRSLLTSLEKRLCTTLQVIGTDSQ